MQTTRIVFSALCRAAPALALGFAVAAQSRPITYTLDPDHTYPSFAADHMGLSTWRGKFTHSTGTATLDRAKQTGSVRVVTTIASIDLGNAAVAQALLSASIPAAVCKVDCAMFDARRYPTAVFQGKLAGFVHGAPTRVVGTFTLHGVTRPLTLKVDHFKCMPDFMLKPRERCGAELSGSLDRAAFGITGGRSFGMDMKVALQIQVEAVQDK